jgi:hypothetical protein
MWLYELMAALAASYGDFWPHFAKAANYLHHFPAANVAREIYLHWIGLQKIATVQYYG